MGPDGSCGALWSRRAWTLSMASAAFGQPAGKGRILEPDWARYPDPSTEFEVLRLTNADYDSWLPPIPARAVSRRNSEVLVASNRTGSLQLHRIDLGNGRWRLLTEAEALDRECATFSADDRQIFYVDNGRLMAAATGNLREQILYELEAGSSIRGPLAPTEDGTSLFFTEVRGSKEAIVRFRLPKLGPEAVLEEEQGVVAPAPNPRRATVVWISRAGECLLSAFDGSGRRKVETPMGTVLQAFWSPDGRELLYLLDPGVAGQLVQIRSQEIDSRTDILVAKTSQFACFASNRNASVFLGASRSKASPSMLLMLRATRRELTLCEHKAAQPAMTAPRFTLNSQRILFESDRHGKPAVYSMNVERLVEKTDS